MNEMYIHNIDLYTEQGWMKDGSLWIEGHTIKEIRSGNHPPPVLQSGIKVIDGKGLKAIPGFIDSHIHGANGSDVMDGDERALSTIASALPQEGTTRFIATTMTAPQEQIEQVLRTVALYKQKEGEARIEGIHVEGPFIAKERAGAQATHAIIPPDAALLTHWQYVAQGSIKTITLAPELDENGVCIKHAVELGINVSAGHTSSTYEMMKRSVACGVSQVTHLCNAMPGLHHRDISVVGAVAKLSELSAELIVDGIHVTDEMVEILVKLIGSDRLILITDGMRAKYMQPGTYDLGGQVVYVTENNEARLENGSLAGSMVRMNEAARRMSHIPGITWEEVVHMTSYNPAVQLGIDSYTGSLKQNKDADILLVNDSFQIYLTLCQGSIAHNRLHTYTVK